MASLLSWLGNAAHNTGNFINNDIVHPVENAVQHPSPVARAAVNTASALLNPTAALANTAQRVAPPVFRAVAPVVQAAPHFVVNQAEQLAKPVVGAVRSPIDQIAGLATNNQALLNRAQAENPIAQSGGDFSNAAHDIQNHTNPGADLLKGVGTAGNLVASALPLVGFGKQQAGEALLKAVGRSAAKNAAYGGVVGATQGAQSGSLANTAKSAAIGAGAGAVLGAGGEALGRGATHVAASPLVNNEVGAVGKDVNPVAKEAPTSSRIQPPEALAAPRVVANSLTKGVQTSPDIAPEVQKMVSGQHEVRSTAGLVQNADDMIQQHGLANATQMTHDALSVPDGQISDQTVANSLKVAQANSTAGQAAKLAGDEATANTHFDHAASIYDSVANHLVATGRTSQAASILLRQSPEGLQYSAQKALGKASVEMTPELQGKINDAVSKIRQAPEGSNERSFATQDLQKLVGQHLPQNKGDQATNLWLTGLLSGPQTMTKVALSHTVMNVLEKAKDLPAVAIDKAISGGSQLAGHGVMRSTALTQRGVAHGAGEGLRAAAELMRSGHDTPGTSGFFHGGTEDPQNIGFTQTNYGTGPLGKALNFYTSKIRGIHAAIPKTFYVSAKENDLYKQALAAAKTQGVARDNMDKFINDAVHSASTGATDEADLSAQRATFQQPNKLSQLATSARNVPGAKLLIPFAHIASAILSDVGDYSPIGAGKAIWHAVQENGAKGWTPTVQKHFVEELGRSITGTSALAMGGLLFHKGIMTLGYPTDPKQQALWKADGRQENSILINGQWRNTAALGPIGTVLSMGGYGASSLETNAKGNAAGAALFGAIKNISGQSYLSGLTEAANAVSDPQQSFGTFLKNEASSVVPIAVGTVAKATDPLQRQTNNPLEAIQSKIPGLREKLLPAQDDLGNDLQRQGGVLTNLLDPTRPISAITSPVIQELNRLDAAGSGASPVVAKTIKSGKQTIRLTSQQVYQREQQLGPQISASYSEIMNSPGYAQLSDANKAVALTNASANLAQVQNVKTLINTGNLMQAQNAYNGLTQDQKNMFGGAPSTKDYTNLDANGHQIVTKAPKVVKAKAVKATKVAKAKAVKLPSYKSETAAVDKVAKLVRTATIKVPKVKVSKIKVPKVKAVKLPKFPKIKGIKLA